MKNKIVLSIFLMCFFVIKAMNPVDIRLDSHCPVVTILHDWNGLKEGDDVFICSYEKSKIIDMSEVEKIKNQVEIKLKKIKNRVRKEYDINSYNIVIGDMHSVGLWKTDDTFQKTKGINFFEIPFWKMFRVQMKYTFDDRLWFQLFFLLKENDLDPLPLSMIHWIKVSSDRFETDYNVFSYDRAKIDTYQVQQKL